MMKSYRLAPALCLEWFGDEALLLVGEHDLLLTVNRAAGCLFELLLPVFSGRQFTLNDAEVWLGENFEMAEGSCRIQARTLLAFALKHHLARAVIAGEDDDE